MYLPAFLPGHFFHFNSPPSFLKYLYFTFQLVLKYLDRELRLICDNSKAATNLCADDIKVVPCNTQSTHTHYSSPCRDTVSRDHNKSHIQEGSAGFKKEDATNGNTHRFQRPTFTSSSSRRRVLASQAAADSRQGERSASRRDQPSPQLHHMELNVQRNYRVLYRKEEESSKQKVCQLDRPDH